jgi:hypothetical protein
MSHRSWISSGRIERSRSRVVLMLGTVPVVLLGYILSGFDRIDPWLIPGLAGLAVVVGVLGFRRVRARQRWEAAWEAYAAQQGSREEIAAV